MLTSSLGSYTIAGLLIIDEGEREPSERIVKSSEPSTQDILDL